MKPAASGSGPEGARQPAVRWTGVAQIVVILAVVAVAIWFARAPTAARADAVAPITGASPTPTVDVVRPQVTSAAREVRTTGTVSVAGSVTLRSRVGGEVVAVSPALRSGGSFAAGDPLVWIDRTDHEISLEAARAGLRHAQARLAVQQLRGEAGVRRSDRRRAAAEPDDRPPDLAARVPQIAREQARVDAAMIAVEKAERDLSRTTLSLPFDGRVIGGSIAVGAIVSPGAPLAEVFAKDAVQVEASVSQEDLRALDPVIGRAANVRTAGGTFRVVVQRVSAVVDQQSRLAMLYLTFAPDVDPDALPRPGSFAQLALEGPLLKGVMILPEATEQFDGHVWVVEAGALRSFQPRSLGRTRAGWLVEAFDPGEGVVIGRVARARSGLPVAPVEAAPAAPSSDT